MRLGSRPFFVIALVLLVGIGLLAPGVAQGACPWLFSWACDSVLGGIFFLIQAVGYLMGWLIALAGSILEYLIKAGNVGQAGAIKAAWVAVRDLANLFFGLGMIVIALATIFRLEGYGWKRALPRLIIAAILINFSFVIAGTIIDIGNIFSFFFLNQLKGQYLSTAIASALGIENTFDISKPEEGTFKEIGKGIGAIASLLFTVVMLAVTAVTFGTGVVFLFVRIFMLWLLIVLSPIVWIFWVFPGTQQYWHKWWETFLKWVFFAPIYVFMIWLALYIITSKNTITKLITSDLRASQQINQLQQQPNILLTKGTTPQAVMQFAFMAVMMFGALYVAQMGGMYGAQAGMKLAQGVPKKLLRTGERWVARGAPTPRILPGISKVAQKLGLSKIAKMTEKTIGERFGDTLEKRLGRFGKVMRGSRSFLPKLASPKAVSQWWAHIQAKADARTFPEASGAVEDVAEALRHPVAYLKGRRTHNAEQAHQGEVDKKLGELRKTVKSEDTAVLHFLSAIATKDPVETEAAFRHLDHFNGYNTLFANERFTGILGKDAGPTEYNPETYREFIMKNMENYIGKERATTMAMDLSGSAAEGGHFERVGLTEINKSTGDLDFTQNIARQYFIARNKAKEMEPQDLMRRLHPDSVRGRDNTGALDNLHDLGKMLIGDMSQTHIDQMNRMQIRTVDTLAQPDVAAVNKAVNDRAVERQRSQGGARPQRIFLTDASGTQHELISEAEMQTLFTSPPFSTETDMDLRRALLAQELERQRVAKDFVVPSIDTLYTPGTPESTRAYRDWDRKRVDEILGR